MQVSQRLQETSEAYAADNGSLARRIGDQEQSLGQAQSQLRQAEKNLLRLETALGESRKLAKETREQLYQKTVELNATRDELATVQNQRKEAEKKLNASVAKACSGEQIRALSFGRLAALDYLAAASGKRDMLLLGQVSDSLRRRREDQKVAFHLLQSAHAKSKNSLASGV